MLRNITHALSPTHTDVASAMTEIFTGSELKRIYPKHVAPVMQRFGLRTFEAMLPEEAKHEAT
jgi:hypothetical protein